MFSSVNLNRTWWSFRNDWSTYGWGKWSHIPALSFRTRELEHRRDHHVSSADRKIPRGTEALPACISGVKKGYNKIPRVVLRTPSENQASQYILARSKDTQDGSKLPILTPRMYATAGKRWSARCNWQNYVLAPSADSKETNHKFISCEQCPWLIRLPTIVNI